MEFDKSIANAGTMYASDFTAVQSPLGGPSVDAISSRRVVSHKLRNRQKIFLPPKPCDRIYVVADGVALIEASFSGGRPQIASILFPGDAILPSTLPPIIRPAITCVSKQGIILQRDLAASSASGASDLPLPHDIASEVKFNSARATLHGTIVANLTSEEKVATVLTEFAFRLGKPFAGGCIFEMPLSRSDIAVFLGLNPDTVSRIISAMKADGLIKTYGRGSISCSNFQALMARSPVSDLLRQMLHERRPALL